MYICGIFTIAMYRGMEMWAKKENQIWHLNKYKRLWLNITTDIISLKGRTGGKKTKRKKKPSQSVDWPSWLHKETPYINLFIYFTLGKKPSRNKHHAFNWSTFSNLHVQTKHFRVSSSVSFSLCQPSDFVRIDRKLEGMCINTPSVISTSAGMIVSTLY